MSNPRDRYEQALSAQNAELTVIQARWNRLSNLRLTVAVLLVAAVIVAVQTVELVYALVAVAVLAIFVGLVVAHRRESHRRRVALARIALLGESIARIDRTWDAIPERSATASAGHAYADDIDVVGRASLLRLVDRTETPAGAARLAAWLLSAPPAHETTLRQAAARRLVDEASWRTELQLAGRLATREAGDPTPLFRWLASAKPMPPLVRWLAVLSTAATLLLVLADLTGLIEPPLWVPFVLLNGALAFGQSRGTERLGEIARLRRSLSQYRHVLPVVERAPTGTDRLDHLRDRLSVRGGSASEQLTNLDRRLNFVIPPATIVWPLLQLGLAWDIHVAGAIQRWAARHAGAVPAWVDAVAELEALSSLAGLAADNPDWAWPRIEPASTVLRGETIGHPLLPGAVRVGNDVEIGPSGTLLLVTGSNMAGKSTMLRAVGINAVLARAGGPVSGRSLSLPPWDVWTSVRIRDSVEMGISLYMAELLRLRQIVDAARTRPILYLLDEVLQGTNTTERRIAAQRIIATLLGTGAIGAVSTHDLELLTGSGFEDEATPVHFRDEVVDTPTGPEMRFDYRMRPGIAPSTNALRLLALVGLDDGAATITPPAGLPPGRSDGTGTA